VLRGCSRELRAPFLTTPLTPRTLVVLRLARAYARSGDLNDAFLGNSWSECPAREVIPEMLRNAWSAAQRQGARK
jgi:hypothetical protein